MNGTVNPNYTGPYVFTNDFAALYGRDNPNAGQTAHAGTGPAKDEGLSAAADPLFQAQQEPGLCKVICFSPDHSKSLPLMSVAEIVQVIQLWQQESINIGSQPHINNIQIFENKGQVMGCSNPHPHGQIWAQHSIPDEVKKEAEHQAAFLKQHGKVLLADYVQKELKHKERIVVETQYFVSLVPFWATWPFETLVLPKQPAAHITRLNAEQVTDFAKALQLTTIKYDNLFNTSFPYSAGIHQAPFDGKPHEHWHWHMHFYPALLRSASVKKFMVGYEMLAEPQRDTTPEQSAQLLREQSNEHYLHRLPPLNTNPQQQ